jgi:hypothetical protein
LNLENFISRELGKSYTKFTMYTEFFMY